MRFSAHMIEPQISPLIGFPSPGLLELTERLPAKSFGWISTPMPTSTNIAASSPENRADPTRPGSENAGGIVVQRWTDALLKEAETTPLVPPPPEPVHDPSKPTLTDRIQQFYAKEGVVAALDRGGDAYLVAGDNQMSWRTQHVDGGTIFVTTGGPHDNEHAGKNLVPSITLAVEHYNRMVRILDKKIPVKVELNVQTQFYDEAEPNGINVIADLPGGELASEQVILGAHLDSHQSATGATDNGAGSAVMMDAMRILKALNVKPRRTIRIALWGGEEEGLLGSKAYVRDHLFDEADQDAQTGMPQRRRLLQHGQRYGPGSRHLAAGEPRHRADFQNLVSIAARPGCAGHYRSAGG